MERTQIASMVNTAIKEATGQENVVLEDLTNLVEAGTVLAEAQGYDKFTKSLSNQVGYTYFASRKYAGRANSVLRKDWEYGSIMRKIRVEMPDAVKNETWDLVDGTSYDPNVFHAPVATEKFWNKKTTFEIDISITDRQVKESFVSEDNMRSFIAYIQLEVENKLTKALEETTQKAINNLIGETLYDEFNSGKYGDGTGIRAINLLYMYNQATGNTLKAKDALKDKDFYKFATHQISLTEDRFASMSTLFNMGGKVRFTPKDKMHVMLWSNFVRGSEVYLESDTFHNEFVTLPKGETIPYWQGTGTDYSDDSTSKVHITTASGHEVEATGILGVIFDDEAVMLCNYDRRITSNYNGKAEFTNYFYKEDCSYYNDYDENAVVFYIADPTA